MADGSVTIEVTLTKEQLEKGLKSINKDLNELAGAKIGAGISKVGQTITNIGNSMVNTGKKIAVATAGIVAGLGTAVGRFDTLKNYPKVLSNLGISAEDAEKSIKDLSDGIDGLPTALDDAASGVQRLVAKNGNIKKSTKYFLAMNDAIVAGNAPAQQQASAIEQLTQAYSKGKFDMMEWRTLMMAMPGQMKQIANAMGYVNTDKLYEALQKGRVSMDQFMDKIVELDENGGKGFKSFQEQAKNSTDSIGTAITNLGNRIKKGFATILEGLDEMAKNTKFGSIAGIINQFSTSIKNFLDKIGKSLKNNKELQKTFGQITQGLTKLQTVIDKLSPEQVDAIVTALVKLAKAGPKLMIVGKGLSLFGKTTTGIGNMVTMFSKLSGSISGVGATTATAATTGTKGVGILSKAFTALSGPVGIVIAIITAVIGALVVLYKKSESFRNTVHEVIEGIKNALMKAWEKIKPAFEKLGEALKKLWDAIEKVIVALEPILSPVLKAIGKSLEIIIDVLSVLITIIAEIITVVINALTKVLEKIPNIINEVIDFFTKTIPKAFTDFKNKVVEIFNSIVDFFVGCWNSIVSFFTEGIPSFINSIIEWFKKLPYNIGVFLGQMVGAVIKFGVAAWNWVTVELPKIINGIIQWFSELPGKIWTWLQETYNKVMQWGVNTYNSAVQWAYSTITGIIQWFKELPGKIWTWLQNTLVNIGKWGVEMINKAKQGAKDFSDSFVNKIKELPGKMLEIGKNILQGLWNGIVNAKNWLMNKVGELARGILDGMKNALGIHSPSKLFEDQVGKNIALGIGEGFENNIAKVYRQMKSAVDFETQKLSANLSTSATMSKVLTANISVTGDTYMDSTKVGRLVTPVVSRTLRTAGV